MTLQAGDKLMSLADVSEMLGIPVHTLHRWRCKGDGPVGYRVGRHVRYRREAVGLAGTAPRPTLASGRRQIGPRAADKALNREPSQSGLERSQASWPLGSRVLRPMSISAGRVGV